MRGSIYNSFVKGRLTPATSGSSGEEKKASKTEGKRESFDLREARKRWRVSLTDARSYWVGNSGNMKRGSASGRGSDERKLRAGRGLNVRKNRQPRGGLKNICIEKAHTGTGKAAIWGGREVSSEKQPVSSKARRYFQDVVRETTMPGNPNSSTTTQKTAPQDVSQGKKK